MDLMSSRLAWSTKQAPEQPKLHRENLSQNQTKPKQQHSLEQQQQANTSQELTPSLREGGTLGGTHCLLRRWL